MSATRLPDDDPDVIDMDVQRILDMTPEEIRADYLARGEDPDEVARRCQEETRRAIADCAKPWRTLRTAPRDGRKIWVKAKDGEISTVYANDCWAATEAKRHYTHWRPYHRIVHEIGAPQGQA